MDGQTHTDRQTDTATDNIKRTVKAWATETGRKPESVMRKIRRTKDSGSDIFSPSFGIDSELTDGQVLFLSGTNKPAIRVQSYSQEAYAYPVNEVEELPKEEAPKEEMNVTTPPKKGYKILLWGCLCLSLGCSIPNMLWVAHSLRSDIWQSYAITAAFTISPLLLVWYGVGRWLKWVPYSVIAIEVFCNAAGFYGGMTGLANSLYVKPTQFLHMVTTMTDSGNEQTALGLAVIFAAGIAVLAVSAVIELEKK